MAACASAHDVLHSGLARRPYRIAAGVRRLRTECGEQPYCFDTSERSLQRTVGTAANVTVAIRCDLESHRVSEATTSLPITALRQFSRNAQHRSEGWVAI